MGMNELLIGLILIPPLIGALFSWLSDKIQKNSSRFLGIISIGISAITNFIGFMLFMTDNWAPNSLDFTTKFNFTDPIILSISPDALGIFMSLVASFLGLLIAIFSYEYMNDDKHITIYWFFFQLFISGMILLVLAGDLILLYIGWEIVGLCSYGLISHWRNKPGEQGKKAGLAGIKAFVFTRFGDIGFLIAIVLIYKELGSVDFQTISEAGTGLSPKLISIIGILFLLAAFGKSAQVPFIPWLSSPENVDIDAMQGPTTVSALIHAATMVKAGVYLISRMFLLLPLWTSTMFLWIILITSGLTTLIAALSALVCFDLKRILAYSTVSQLGYMFLGLSVAFISQAASDDHLALTAFLSVQFHLISHAIFKSLLFLSAGYLIHSFGTRDIRELKATASWNYDRQSFLAFATGGLGLAGIPPLNGYFSKEAIIGTSYAGLGSIDYSELYRFAYAISVITAIITAIYVSRLFFYLFFGNSDQKTDSHDHSIMPAIMIVLSLFAIFGGFFQLILPNYFDPLIGDAEFHHLFGDDIVHTLFLTSLMTIVIILTIELFKQDQFIHSITSFFVIRWLATVSKAGFYLEDLWIGGLYLVKRGTFGFRKTHSGNLNDMLLGGLIIILVITFFIIGGGL